MPSLLRKSYWKGISSSIVISFFLFVYSPPVHGQDTAYLSELLAKAEQQNLPGDPYWHILMHYKRRYRGFISRIDDPAFFLAPDGKTNPKAELQATLRAFFTPESDEKKSAVCRFPARFEWLKQRLNIDTTRLPIDACHSFEQFMDQVKPESATLIFPMAHLNGPASMFGHTLLSIETANRSKLLAYAVTYSAFTNETFGPFFAVKGLTGLYPGYFSIMPYYAKLQEYSDIDHRDIWEYPLNLTKPEIRRMMLHVREMDHIASDYYFFDENCSYALYFLLEAARPGVHLIDQTPAWLTPLDSVRAIAEQGFITGVDYRPSRTTKINHLAAGLPEPAQDLSLELAHGKTLGDPLSAPSISSREKIKTLELAGEYLQYLYTKGLISQETYQQRFIPLLKERSRLGLAQDVAADQIRMPVPPDKGHRSDRLSLGTGYKDDDWFMETRIRPVYHDLLDNDDGYVRGAQLIFAELVLRAYPAAHKIALESLDIIDLVSLAPRDKFFQPTSWKVKTGLTRMTMADGRDHLVYQINPGGGWCLGSRTLGLVYALFETEAVVGGALEHDYAIGAGASAGILANPHDRWKVHVYGRGISYGLGDRFSSIEAGVQQNVTLTPNQSIRLDFLRRKTHGYYESDTRLAWNYYF